MSKVDLNKVREQIGNIDSSFVSKNPGKSGSSKCPYCGLEGGIHKANCSYMNKYLKQE